MLLDERRELDGLRGLLLIDRERCGMITVESRRQSHHEAFTVAALGDSLLRFVRTTRHGANLVRDFRHSVLAAIGAADGASVVVADADPLSRRLDRHILLVEQSQEGSSLQVCDLIILSHHLVY